MYLTFEGISFMFSWEENKYKTRLSVHYNDRTRHQKFHKSNLRKFHNFSFQNLNTNSKQAKNTHSIVGFANRNRPIYKNFGAQKRTFLGAKLTCNIYSSLGRFDVRLLSLLAAAAAPQLAAPLTPPLRGGLSSRAPQTYTAPPGLRQSQGSQSSR